MRLKISKKYAMSYLENIILLQLFHGEKEQQNLMYHLVFLKIMNGLLYMPKRILLLQALKVKKGSILLLQIFLINLGEFMI